MMSDKEKPRPSQVATEEPDIKGIDPDLSDAVVRLYKRACAAKSRGERSAALMELAKTFAEEHDLTDFTATDDWHAYIEEYIQARMTFHRASLRLGRLAVNTLAVHFDENEVSEDDLDERGNRTLN